MKRRTLLSALAVSTSSAMADDSAELKRQLENDITDFSFAWVDLMKATRNGTWDYKQAARVSKAFHKLESNPFWAGKQK